jgi:2-oxoglutarate ferredoxin oxidoreductase subunit alpha
MDYTLRIGGQAGQGVQTVGELLAQVFASSGYHVFANQDYESRVRGGNNFYQVRVSSEPVVSCTDKVHLMIALDAASVDIHQPSLAEGGILAYEADAFPDPPDNDALLGIPFKTLAVNSGGSALMANTVAVGAGLGMLGMQLDTLNGLLEKQFHKKGAEVIENNLKAAQAGHKYAKENCRQCRFLPAKGSEIPLLLMNTPECAAVGALASGCRFYSAYPMTPSTSLMNHIAAAINMALGASFAGVRAATGSSGGGFALMVEGLSLAGMTETPIVIFEVQRPGPATGFPTRTETADLLFVAHAGHGEFPRVILAPGSPEEALILTNKAFDLAEKYQIPVFVMYDQYLADSYWTYEKLDTSGLVYRDYRLRDAGPTYKRHAFAKDGVSPLAVPGTGTAIVVTDSDEHDEAGHMVEDGPTRISMIHKRLYQKTKAIVSEMPEPEAYGYDEPDTLLIGWGSSRGVLRECVNALGARGNKTGALHFSHVYPLQKGAFLERINKARRVVCVESNAAAQFARLLRMETGVDIRESILRYDGRPLTAGYVLERLGDAIP